MGLRDYVRTNKNQIILAVAGAIALAVLTAVLAVLSGVAQSAITRRSERVQIDIQPTSASVAGFATARSLEAVQLLTYRISASGYVDSVVIAIVFQKGVQVLRQNVIYSVQVEGFDSRSPRPNELLLSLTHNLDLTRQVTVHLLTKREVQHREDVRVEYADIHVKGRDSDGHIVYR